MDALAGPSHPDHAEYSAWVAEITGSDEPFDPVFLDIAAVNRELAEHFWPFRGKTSVFGASYSPFYGPPPPVFERR